MKLRIVFSILFIICVNAKIFAANDSMSDKCFCLDESINTHLNGSISKGLPRTTASLSDSLAYTTALINSLNNTISVENKHLTAIDIIVGLLSLAFAILGVLSILGIKNTKDYEEKIETSLKEYKKSIDDEIDKIISVLKEHKNDIEKNTGKLENDLKDFKNNTNSDIKEYKKEIDKDRITLENDLRDFKKVTNIDNKEYKEGIDKSFYNLKSELQDLIKETKSLGVDIQEKGEKLFDVLKFQEYQNQYLQRINQYLFLVTNSVVDINGGGGAASGIRVVLYNQYNIVKVFLPWSDSPTDGTEAAFRYLQVNGTIVNIGDLQFIADNDPDERKRKMAQETIGYIKARLMNNQA